MQTIKEYQKQVQELIIQEKWAEAYRICNEILRLDPENSQFSKFKIIIEKKVKENNVKAIKHEISKLEPLLEQHQFAEYLRQISPLQNYLDDYPEIGPLILNAKRAMEQDYADQLEATFQNELSSIKSIPSSNLNYEQVIERLNQLKKLGIRQTELENHINKYKEQWIDQEIAQNAKLIESNKFEDIIIFLLKLQKKTPNNNKIKKLITSTKEKYQYYKIDSKKDFLFKTLEEIKTLFLKKSYDKAIFLAERVLEIDPQNIKAQKYLQQSQNKAERISTIIIEKKIEENYNNFPHTKFYQNKQYLRI